MNVEQAKRNVETLFGSSGRLREVYLMKPTLPLLTALLEPSAQSRRLLTRRETLMTVGAGVAAMLLPGSVRGQQDTRGGTDLGAVLSRMTLADKVGQLLMA